MQVKLVSHTIPSPELLEEGIETIEDLIAFCARVSNPSNQMNVETADKLIAYLLKHKHFSPFEMVSICLEITTTRDIARQILRHRSFTFQEFSQRYADPTKDLAFEIREARLQDKKNRQNSIEVDDPDLKLMWDLTQKRIIGEAMLAYNWAIDNGIAKEVARAVLPEGLTISRLYVNGTVRSWIHYIELRTANGTQKEHIEIARECARVIATVFSLIKEYSNDS